MHAFWHCQATAEIRNRYEGAMAIYKEYEEGQDALAPLVQYGLIPKNPYITSAEGLMPAHAEVSMAQ